MRTFVALALVLCLAIMPVAVAQAEEKGAWSDWYGMVELQSGLTWNFEEQTWTPYVSTLFLGYRAVRAVIGTELAEDEPVAGLFAVTYNLGSLKDMGVDVPWMEHFGFNIGPCVRYEFATGEVEWTAMLSIVDLSFSGGNAQAQRER